MKKTKKQVYHIHDKVKIINPAVFIRCGYPLTKNLIKEHHITEEEKLKIMKLVESFGLLKYPAEVTNYVESNGYYEKILDIIAGGRLKQKGFGGRERSIHTQNREELRGFLGHIESKKIVKTGKYCPGSSRGYSYFYDYDYDPPYLEHEKSHVILSLSIYDPKRLSNQIAPYETIWIEEKNVEIWKDDEH